MYAQAGNEGTLLTLFLTNLFLALVSLLAAWVRGRRWGDLASGRHYGEVLSEDERRELARSRRGCLIWVGLSILFAALAFWLLER
jgi:hypothetical protein